MTDPMTLTPPPGPQAFGGPEMQPEMQHGQPAALPPSDGPPSGAWSDPAMQSWLAGRFEENVLTTTIERMLNWGQQASVWPMTFGIACCAIEMMATGAAKYDLDRFGAGAFRATPRQADLMIVAGTVTYKMASRVRRLYEQMPDPKSVIAMGACTIGGGPYFKYGYHVVKGVDLVVPVDVYVPGCPPRPEALLEGIMRIQDKMKHRRLTRGEYTLPLPHHSGYVREPETVGLDETTRPSPQDVVAHEKIEAERAAAAKAEKAKAKAAEKAAAATAAGPPSVSS